MKPLATLKRGPKILRAWLNHLRAHVTANRILRGENYEVNEHPGGAQLVIRFPPAAAAAPTEAYTINMGSEPAITAGNWVDVNIPITGLTGTGETVIVRTGEHDPEIALTQTWTIANAAVLRFRNLNTGASATWGASDIVVRVVR